jgi:hypothetical protein
MHRILSTLAQNLDKKRLYKVADSIDSMIKLANRWDTSQVPAEIKEEVAKLNLGSNGKLAKALEIALYQSMLAADNPAQQFQWAKNHLISVRDWANSSGEKYWKCKDYREMVYRSQEWHEKIAKQNAGKGHPALYATRDVVYTYPNGWTMQRLSADDLANEGSLMSNCIGQGTTYKNQIRDEGLEVLSLRDEQNNPHATIGIDLIESDEYSDQEIFLIRHYRQLNGENYHKQYWEEKERELREELAPQFSDDKYWEYERAVEEALKNSHEPEWNEDSFDEDIDPTPEQRAEIRKDLQSYIERTTEQIQGAQNEAPIQKYRDMIVEYFDYFDKRNPNNPINIVGDRWNIKNVSEVLEALYDEQDYTLLDALATVDKEPVFETIIKNWTIMDAGQWNINFIAPVVEYAWDKALKGSMEHKAFIDRMLGPDYIGQTLDSLLYPTNIDAATLRLGNLTGMAPILLQKMQEYTGPEDTSILADLLEHLHRNTRGRRELPAIAIPAVKQIILNNPSYMMTHVLPNLLHTLAKSNISPDDFVEVINATADIVARKPKITTDMQDNYILPLRRYLSTIYHNDPEIFWQMLDKLSTSAYQILNASHYDDKPHPLYTKENDVNGLYDPLDRDKAETLPFEEASREGLSNLYYDPYKQVEINKQIRERMLQNQLLRKKQWESELEQEQFDYASVMNKMRKLAGKRKLTILYHI